MFWAAPIFLILALSGCSSLEFAGWNSTRTVSPNGQVRVDVTTRRDGRLIYRVLFKGRTVIEPSALGLAVDGRDLGAEVRLGNVERASLDQQYAWRGVKSVARNHYNESRLQVLSGNGAAFRLDARAFDDGVAFRYVIPGSGTRTVSGEATRFTLPAGSRVWWAPMRRQYDYEGRYKVSGIAEIPEGTRMAPPTTVELPVGGFAALTEGDLENFDGMHLVSGSNRVMQCGFEQPSWELSGEIKSPWRVIMLADDLNGLVNCDIVHNVCSPPSPQLAKAEWIKSGISTWSYLGGGGRTMDNEKMYSAWCGELGFSYNLVDAGWENWPDKWGSLKELVDFARQYNVGTLVWKHKSSITDPAARRDFFKRLRDCGVVGVKIDFINSETLDAVEFYTATLKDAADCKLMVLFHGCDKPTGLERTWPNEIGREGIPGLEKRPPWASQNCTLPFTRLLAGHADFTPMSFQPGKIGETSFAHQIATALAYTTSLQNMGAHPMAMLTNAAADFIKQIPVDWDETVVLAPSKIGGLLAFARRKGDTWFVCVLNGDEKNPKAMTLSLPFLANGAYDAAIVKDNLQDQYAVLVESARFGQTNATAGSRLENAPKSENTLAPGTNVVQVTMRAGGGWAARFSRPGASSVTASPAPRRRQSPAATPNQMESRPVAPKLVEGGTNQTGAADSVADETEAFTRWNQAPKWIMETNGGYRSVGLRSFEGQEPPVMRYLKDERRVARQEYVNIIDSGRGAVRMYLRYRGDWWDGDQGTPRSDRQRAEIKGLGPHQKDGETFEYGTTFRTDPNFQGWGRFCHIFQLKATDGDKGPPLVTLSILEGTNSGALQYDSGRNGFRIARRFNWTPGQWETVRIRVKTSTNNTGELMLSVNGDEFQGAQGVPIYRPQSSDYRPKWGLYRGVSTGMHDDWVEHKDAVARKLSPANP